MNPFRFKSNKNTLSCFHFDLKQWMNSAHTNVTIEVKDKSAWTTYRFFFSLFLALVNNRSKEKSGQTEHIVRRAIIEKAFEHSTTIDKCKRPKVSPSIGFWWKPFPCWQLSCAKIVRWLGNIVTFDRLSARATKTKFFVRQKNGGKKTGPSNKVWTEIVCSVKHVQNIFHQHVKSRIFRCLEMCANYSFLYCYFSHLSCVLFFSFFSYFLNISLKMAFFVIFTLRMISQVWSFSLTPWKNLFFSSELLSTREKPSELHSNFYLLFVKLLFQPNKDRTNQMKTTKTWGKKNIINYSAFSVDFVEFLLWYRLCFCVWKVLRLLFRIYRCNLGAVCSCSFIISKFTVHTHLPYSGSSVRLFCTVCIHGVFEVCFVATFIVFRWITFRCAGLFFSSSSSFIVFKRKRNGKCMKERMKKSKKNKKKCRQKIYLFGKIMREQRECSHSQHEGRKSEREKKKYTHTYTG